MKAIVFDIDGTAVPNSREGMPSPTLIRQVEQAKGKLHLIAATARPISLALPVFQKLGLVAPCVVSGGTTIVDPVSGDVLRHTSLGIDQLSEIKRICEQFPYTIGFDDELPAQRRHASEWIAVTPVSIIFIPQVISEHLPSLLSHLNHVDGVYATSTYGWTGGHVIHVTTSDGSKEAGIKYVLNRIGVQQSEAVGVGDGDNDLHLFASVGHRVAMGNASDNLKSAADAIVATVKDDGLADVIAHFAGELGCVD
jgi:HAD superfamily hydrolase (TIGR01484 family)